MKVKYFDYPLQFNMHRSEYLKIIDRLFSRGAFLFGKDLEQFEDNLVAFCHSKYAVGVGNCTDALLLSLAAAGVGRGDEVISVSHTFVATIEVIKFLGAKPVFVDIAEDHNMDIGLVEKAITRKTKAILPVHLNGKICYGMDRLVKIAKKHHLAIIEDAAQSLGATYKGKHAGTFGLGGCFSFYPAKLLGAFGDAGAVITDNRAFAEKLRMLRNHGRGKGLDTDCWGLNCRMDNIHAAILDYKLKKVPAWIARRRQIAEYYYQELCGVKEIVLPPTLYSDDDYFHVFQNLEIEAEDRGRLIKYLKEKGIEAALPWGGKAVHQFKALGFKDVYLPRTEALFKKVLMLPIYPGFTDSRIKYTAAKIRAFYHG